MHISLAEIGYRYVPWRVALAGVNFAVDGGTLGVLGRNGSGKTTLLRIMATRIAPTSGTIRFATTDGVEMHRQQVRATIGYVPQFDTIPDHMTVGQFIEYVALQKGWRDRSVRAQACQQALETCHLAASTQQRAGDLAGGERRRLLIAQALLGQPELLVLDEPLTGLDPLERRDLLTFFMTLPQPLKVWATHHPEELSGNCSHLLVLEHGMPIYSGAPPELATVEHANLPPAVAAFYQTTSQERIVTMSAPASTVSVAAVHATGLTITVSQIGKRYRGKPHALHDVDLTIPPGVFGLLGRNGAGKTTLLQIIATLLDPTTGQVRVGPYDVRRDRWEIRRRLGFLPQEHGFYPTLTVRETLRYFATLQGLPQIGVAIDSVLEAVNLTDQQRRRVSTLSGGMRRRLGLAQALLGDPPVLIVDEPTAGLDPIEQQRFRSMLGILGASGDRTIILSTHIIEDVAATATHLAVLEAGQVSFSGTPQQLAALAQGRAWQWQTSLVEIERRRKAGDLAIVSLTPVIGTAEVVNAAVVGAVPDAAATPREPGIADGYLVCIGLEVTDEQRH